MSFPSSGRASSALPNAVAPQAPAAARPGFGSGNVPYAPGMASGKFGQTQPPPARAVAPPPPRMPHPGGPGQPAGPAAGLAQHPPTPPPMGPGPALQASPFWPDMQMWGEMVGAYFEALKREANMGSGGFL